MHKVPFVLAAAALALSACKSSSTPPLGIDVPIALDTTSLELTLGPDGYPAEIEYHIDPAKVPENIRAAMDGLHPGGPFTDAEREWTDGVMYYELSRVVGGREVEAMFSLDAVLFSEEIEVRREQVPDAVHEALADRYPVARINKYEEIRDASRTVVEYHVKLNDGGKKYKVALSLEGAIIGVWTETPAEIELPVQ